MNHAPRGARKSSPPVRRPRNWAARTARFFKLPGGQKDAGREGSGMARSRPAILWG